MIENLCLSDIPKFLYHAILRSVKDPFNIIDRNFRILWTNRTKAGTQMIGKFCYQLFQERSEPCSECPVRSVFGTGKVCTMERWVDLWDGWRELRAYPVYDKNGNVVYAVKIGFDITDRRSSLARQKSLDLLERFRLGYVADDCSDVLLRKRLHRLQIHTQDEPGFSSDFSGCLNPTARRRAHVEHNVASFYEMVLRRRLRKLVSCSRTVLFGFSLFIIIVPFSILDPSFGQNCRHLRKLARFRLKRGPNRLVSCSFSAKSWLWGRIWRCLGTASTGS